jgi:histone deacetylase 11
LEHTNVVHRQDTVHAVEASPAMLRSVHADAYLRALETSPLKVAQVTELSPLAALPACLLRRRVLAPMKFMAGGTLAAGALALERGWAVKLGGGMHHAHFDDGGGWCAYDDISLLITQLRAASEGRIRRFLVVDLDVHQGNGHARSKLHRRDADTFIVDVYNRDIYPRDEAAAAAVDVGVGLPSATGDAAYLEAVRAALREAFRRCQPPPDMVVYNAGTDILAGDPLGLLAVSAAGVVARDEAVFAAALEARVPIVMLPSGGYTAGSTPCIAASIGNLVGHFRLTAGAAGARGEAASAAGAAAGG